MTCDACSASGRVATRRLLRPLRPPNEGIAGMCVLQRRRRFVDAPEFSGAGASGRNRGPAWLVASPLGEDAGRTAASCVSGGMRVAHASSPPRVKGCGVTHTPVVNNTPPGRLPLVWTETAGTEGDGAVRAVLRGVRGRCRLQALAR